MDKKALLLTTKIGYSSGARWLTDDFVDELLNLGWSVDVVVMNLSGVKVNRDANCRPNLSVETFSVNRKRPFLLFTLLYAYARVLYFVVKCLLLRKSYDLVISHSIGSIFPFVVSFMHLLRRVKKSLFVMWDFFPVHHHQIGVVKPRIFLPLLKTLEKRVVFSHSAIAFMSPRNIEYFDHYFPGYCGKKFCAGLWAADALEAVDVGNIIDKDSTLTLIFGGQLVPGRGIETLVALARQLEVRDLDALIHVYGSGRLESLITAAAGSGDSKIIMHGQVSKKSYYQALMQSDVGIVATVQGVDVPTFPSKMLDYICFSKPILASVEPSTDFGDILENEMQAGISVEAGDLMGLVDALERLLNLKRDGRLPLMGLNGREYFEKNYMVNNVVKKMLIELFGVD